MHGRLIAIAALVLAGALLLQSVGFAQRRLGFVDWRQHRAIAYDTRPAKDPVARLQAAIDEGTIVLERRGESGYLRSLLDALAVPVESQIVVFEPDSL